MQQLFEHIPVDSIPFLCTYRSRSVQPFKGFYHWHQCCELLIVHEGEGTVTIGPQVWAIRPGALFFFQPFQLHNVFAVPSADKPYVRSIIHINQAICLPFLEKFPDHKHLFNNLCFGTSSTAAYYLKEHEPLISGSLSLHMSHDERRTAFRQENHMIFLLQMLSLLQANEPRDGNHSSTFRQPKYAEQIMLWIERNFSENFELDRLAEELHLTKSYASRIFRKETGSTITEYLLARRVKQACDLLETTRLSIDAIAVELGFNTSAYFISMFKKVYGITPLQYRKIRLRSP
ncbi:AraC family transcriptional regulator [Paenibacillus sp. HW567]|uniref:AraC family transcriptional regulator n=1 Tax=Paenibacillus sp. HW567 TaxID=1034769 RepID=UPI00036E2C50|nr:AraC family transcriptional regulator [Paenibacillus sp. HW567]